MEMSKMRGMAHNERGMTLIELLAVVVILGILATVAAVAVVNASDKAKINADSTTISVLKDAAQRYIMEKEKNITSTDLEITASDLVGGLYIRDIPKDSAGETFGKLTVNVTTSGTPATSTINWKFYTSEAADTGTFAPKASNK